MAQSQQWQWILTHLTLEQFEEFVLPHLNLGSRGPQPMRFIQELSQGTTSMLSRIYRQSKHFEVRRRSHCILLSFEGFTTTGLMVIFKVSRITIYNWFKAWEENHLAGLYSHPGRGRKSSFTPEQKTQIKELPRLMA